MKSLLLSLTLAATSVIAAPIANANDLASLPWNQIVSQAKSEGKVVWYQWFFTTGFRKVAKDFEDTYGIKVVIIKGSHSANINKFLANARRSKGDIDVLSLGGSDISQINTKKTMIGPLSTLLPNADKLTYKIEGVDSKGYATAYWGNQTGIAYNPALINKNELPQTVTDFSDYLAKKPELFGFNTINGGSGPAFFQSIAHNLVPTINFQTAEPTTATMKKLEPVWQWFKSRRSQYIITASNADSLTRLNGGEFALVPMFEDRLVRSQSNGNVSKKLKFYIPKIGMSGGGNVVVIPKNAPHSAAALLFISWLTSAKTQTTFNKDFGTTAQNKDADTKYSLVTPEENQRSTRWPDKKLGTAINNTFINKVTLN